MQREKRISRLNWWYVSYTVLGILFVAVLVLNFTHNGSKSENEPATGSGQSQNGDSQEAPPVPTSITDEHGYEPDSPEMSKFDCRNTMSNDEYVSFITRLSDFEDIYQMPESSQKLELIVPYVTDNYLETLKGAPDESDTNAVVVIDRVKSAVSCQLDSATQITAKIVPVISVFKTIDGESKLVSGPLTLESHYTVWVLIDKKWYVNQSA